MRDETNDNSRFAINNSRFTKGYKQTEIGIIPEDWKAVKITDCVELKHGFQFREEHFSKAGIKVIKIGNLEDGRGLSFKGITYVPQSKLKQFENFLIKAGDVLMALTGGTLGKVSIVHSNDLLLQNYRVGNFYPKSNAFKKYIYYLLQSSFIQNVTKELVNEAAQPNLGKQDFDKFIIPLPPLTEQEAIAEVLSDTDALITSLDRLIAKKRNLKQGTMQLLLTGKKRLPNFIGDWETKTLGEIADATAGGTPNTQISSYWNGNIRWMSSGELNLKRVYEVTGRITELGLKNSSTKIIPPNCVLVGLAGQGKTRGTVAINKVELCTNQSIAAIYPSKLYVSEFLYHNLDNRYEELRSLSAGDSGRGGLNLTIIKKMEIKLPPTIEEQKAIAEVLSGMDAEIAALEAKRDKYKALKQGMMQELLTGKTRLI